MNSLPVLLALALVPGLYLAVSIYLKDKYEPEPKRVLLEAFVAGCIITLPASIFEFIGTKLFACEGPGIGNALIMAFLLVAPAEEGAKFWVLRYYAYPRKEFNEPLDGIVYGSFIALGFATVENLFYVLQHGFGVGVLRMFISVPGHCAYGVIMGYYVGKAKFETPFRTTHLLRGLCYAILLHGAFDFFLMQRIYGVLYIFTLVILWLALRIASREIKELQADSLFRCQHTPPIITASPVEKTETAATTLNHPKRPHHTEL